MKKKITNIINKIKSNEFWKNLFKNSFFAVIGEGGSSFINLFVVVLLIKLLGSEGYGILILAQSYMTIIDTIINLQCWKGVIKYGEEATANNDDESYMGYLKLGAILDVSTAIMGCIVSLLLVSLVGNILNWSDLLMKCSYIFSFVIIFHFSGTPTAILRMENKFNLVSIQKIVAVLIKLLTIIVILLFKERISVIQGVIVYALTDIIGHLLLVIFALHIVHKKCGIRKVIKSKFPQKTKEFTKFTIWTTMSDIADIPVSYFDVFIISKLGLEMVTIFKFFKQIISLLSKLTTPIYQAIFPQFSKLVAENKKTEAYNVVLKIKKTILTFILPCSIILGLTSNIWLNLLFETSYAQYWYVLTVYLIVHTIALSYTTIHPFFVSLGEVKSSFKYVLVSNIIYIIVSLILIKPINMLAIVIAYTCQFSIIIFCKKRKISKILRLKES